MLKIAGRSITLRDFSLMRDGSPIYYAENFDVKNYGFGKVLIPMNFGNKYVDEDTATITKYAGNAISSVRGIDVVDEDFVDFFYMIDKNSNIFCIKRDLKTGQKIYNTNESCSYPDLKAVGTDVNSSVIYSTKDKVGRIFRGNATGGSSTELDDTSVDFTTADWDLQPGDYVYNLKDNKLFTIDAGGVAATKLTITAVDGGDFASGDNYAIVNPNWKSLTDDKYQYGRQIIEFDEDFYILNGNYLAIVTSAMAYTAEHKAIENGWIARCGASNGDTILIGCNKNNKGKLFLWDKSSNGWLKKIKLDNEIKSIVAYGNSYIYVNGNAIWITDGYNNRVLSEFPGTYDTDDCNVVPKGMFIMKNKVIINGGVGRVNKAKKGIWIYDISKDEWAYSPYDPSSGEEKASYYATGGIIFYESWSDTIYYSFESSSYGWTNTHVLSTFRLSESQYGTVIFNPKQLGKNARIKKIEVNLIQNLRDYTDMAGKSKTLTCKLSDCTRPLWRYCQAKIDGTELDKITVDGITHASWADAEVGDEIFIQNGWNGHLRRTITAIADGGTDTEVWTLDSDLTNLIKQSTTIVVMPFQLYDMDEKTITEETKMLEFYPSFYGDSVMIELRVAGTFNPFIAIESIKIYYE